MGRCPGEAENQSSSPPTEHAASDEGFPSWRGMKSEGSSILSNEEWRHRAVKRVGGTKASGQSQRC